MTIFIHMRPQEVLEAVVNFQPGSGHGHPLPHSVALHMEITPSGHLPQLEGTTVCHCSTITNLHVFQIFNALDHFLFLSICNALCCPLSQAPSSSRWALIVFIFTVWTTARCKVVTLSPSQTFTPFDIISAVTQYTLF